MKFLTYLLLVILVITITPVVHAGTFPGTNGKIVFDTSRDGHYQIYLMDSDGSNQTNISNTPDSDYSADWSADGSRIVFVSERDGVGGGGGEIYVMNADGSNQVRLTNNTGYDEYPSWSPDGSQIVFDSDKDGFGQIYVMNADGSNITNISNTADIERLPAWSPDGSKILFTSDRMGATEIFVMNSDGSNQLNLTNDLDTDQSASWSPDGSQIVFETNRDGNWEIYTMNADGSNQTNISNSPDSEFNGSWSPDGSKILFYSDRDGNGEIYMMNTDGSDQVNLTNNIGVDEIPKWQPVTAPTPSPSSQISSGYTNHTEAGVAPTCSDSMPEAVPDLFQINLNKESAEIYFTPVAHRTGYMVSYSTNPLAEGFGVHVGLSEQGVQQYQINHLLPNTTYYFKVRSQNGCMPGKWSQTLKARTSNTQSLQKVYFY